MLEQYAFPFFFAAFSFGLLIGHYFRFSSRGGNYERTAIRLDHVSRMSRKGSELFVVYDTGVMEYISMANPNEACLWMNLFIEQIDKEDSYDD
jgi:hypothetical protein